MASNFSGGLKHNLNRFLHRHPTRPEWGIAMLSFIGCLVRDRQSALRQSCIRTLVNLLVPVPLYRHHPHHLISHMLILSLICPPLISSLFYSFALHLPAPPPPFLFLPFLSFPHIGPFGFVFKTRLFIFFHCACYADVFVGLRCRQFLPVISIETRLQISIHRPRVSDDFHADPLLHFRLSSDLADTSRCLGIFALQTRIFIFFHRSHRAELPVL